MIEKTTAMKVLDENNIEYEVLTYEAEVFKSGHDVCKKLNVKESDMFKTLAVKGHSGEYYILVLSISKELDFKKAAKVVGEKSLTFVSLKHIKEVTGYVRGGVTLVGIKGDYRIIVNTEMKNLDYVCISAGTLGACLRLKRDDLVNLVKPEFHNIEKICED